MPKRDGYEVCRNIRETSDTPVILVTARGEDFERIMGLDIGADSSFGVYNDAYWCGISYYDLHLRLHKSFAYIFLKLPFEKLLDLYPVYHEMDFSALAEFFEEIAKAKTILRLLCESRKVSLSDISRATTVNLNSLKKYNSSDELLLAGSFQNIYKIGQFFDVPLSLFEASEAA